MSTGLGALSGASLQVEREDAQGKLPTAKDKQDFSLMQAHDLWGDFALIIKGIQEQPGTVENDYLLAQLDSGLPAIRQQLFCHKRWDHCQPTKFLLNHRLASKSNLRALQGVVGRAMVMDRHGRVPTALKMAEAPLWLLELLVPGKFANINWELVYAAAMEIKLTPLDPEVVAGFTTLTRYHDLKFFDSTIDLVHNVLSVWGCEDSDSTAKATGSVRMLLMNHKDSLLEVNGVQAGPAKNHLWNTQYGAFPRLFVALQDAGENYAQFMSSTPAQILVEGSTSRVVRTLSPMVPSTSKYFEMQAMSLTMADKLMEKRQEHPEWYNTDDGGKSANIADRSQLMGDADEAAPAGVGGA